MPVTCAMQPAASCACSHRLQRLLCQTGAPTPVPSRPVSHAGHSDCMLGQVVRSAERPPAADSTALTVQPLQHDALPAPATQSTAAAAATASPIRPCLQSRPFLPSPRSVLPTAALSVCLALGFAALCSAADGAAAPADGGPDAHAHEHQEAVMERSAVRSACAA